MAADDPNSLLRTAEQALRETRLDDAVAAYRAFLRLRPGHADSWFNLAFCYRHLRRFEESLDAYRQALDHHIPLPQEVHVNRAVILSDHLDRPDEAEAELDAALAIEPGYINALLNLGNLREDRGNVAGARDAYDRVLAIDPTDSRSITRLAMLDIFAGKAQAVVDRLEPLLRSPNQSVKQAAELGFAHGHALDQLERYDDAFSAFADANRASRLAEAGMGYDRQAQEHLIDAIIQAFPLPHSAPASGEASPIFICGMFRSGSTLAEQVLAAHPAITTGGELEVLPAIVASSLQPYPQAAVSLDEDALASLRADYLRGLRERLPGAGQVTDKRPDNFLHIGLIKAMFPDARIVHTLREPLDNLLSIYFLHFHSAIGYATDLEDAAHWYKQYRRLMAHWRDLYAGDILDLDYDALVADPEREIRQILDFLGLEWEPACLEPHLVRTIVRTASVWQVRQPLHQRSSGRAQHYASHLGAARRMLDMDERP